MYAPFDDYKATLIIAAVASGRTPKGACGLDGIDIAFSDLKRWVATNPEFSYELEKAEAKRIAEAEQDFGNARGSFEKEYYLKLLKDINPEYWNNGKASVDPLRPNTGNEQAPSFNRKFIETAPTDASTVVPMRNVKIS